MGNNEILGPEGHSNSSWGMALPSPSADSQRQRAWPGTQQKEDLFSQFLIFVFRVFPALERRPDPQRSQLRPGMALCCPLAYSACPALSPLTAQDRARQTCQALQGLLSPPGFESSHHGHLQEWGTDAEPGWRQRGQKGEAYLVFGSHLPSTRHRGLGVG